MGRFSDRTRRLARRQESDVFRHYVMPVSWLIGFIGILALLALSFSENSTDGSSGGTALPVFAAFAAAPFVMLVVRACRGHFHENIREKDSGI